MTSAPLEIEGVVRASELERTGTPDRGAAGWTREELAGRLCELSGAGATASLTWAFELVRETQLDGEPVAWVTCSAESVFYPPDVRGCGVDLSALPVVRAEGRGQAGRAADRLVRSGGFGLVVVDLVEAGTPTSGGEVARPLQKRLLTHAEQQDVAVVFVTEKSGDRPSVGALVSFRGESQCRREGRGRFRCRLEVLADRRYGPGGSREEVVEGPTGLR